MAYLDMLFNCTALHTHYASHLLSILLRALCLCLQAHTLILSASAEPAEIPASVLLPCFSPRSHPCALHPPSTAHLHAGVPFPRHAACSCVPF